MFGIGMPELIVILVIALIVLGPQKLPEIARSLGKGLAEFRRATDDFKQNIRDEALKEEQEKTVKQVETADTGTVPSETAEKEKVKAG